MSVVGTKVEEGAYLKLMLHAAKYPWEAVSGFLLGEGIPGGGKKEVVVKDAVPLFHTSMLSPLLETSASMVDAYAMKQGLAIVGFYQANKLPGQNSPSVLATKVMDRIESRNPESSVLIVISNERLEKAGDHALAAFGKDTGNSFRRFVDVGVSSEAVTAFESALSRRAEVDLVDMDDHFGDVTMDWRNLKLTAQ